jgi:hypothetical protein
MRLSLFSFVSSFGFYLALFFGDVMLAYWIDRWMRERKKRRS